MSTKKKGGEKFTPALSLVPQIQDAADKKAAAVEQATQLDGTQANAEHIDPASLIMVETTQDFANMITGWHTANIETLKMMAPIPGDGSLKFEFEEKEHMMEGDIHIGYRMGIYAALGMMGQLPFAEVPDPAPAQASNDEPNQEPG